MSTFCPLPWNSINVRNNGNCRVCCNANSYTKNKGILRNNNGVPHNAGTSNFDEIRNADLLKEIRSTMLKGEWHAECQRCSNEEASGLSSRREYENNNYPEVEALAKANTNLDGSIDTNIVPLQYMDIRYGNFCNLKCRMCGATDSHMWIPDLHKMGIKKYNESDRQVNIIIKEDGKATIDYDYNWFGKDEKFNLQVMSNIDNIKKFYIVGGEPLFIEEHYNFLEMVVDSGYANQIYLEYNTNMMNVPDTVIELWKQFKGVLLGCSIDGYGTVIELQRAPARWSTLYKNLKKVNKFVSEGEPIRYDFNLPSVKYSSAAWIAFTITNINVFHLPEFIKWKIEESGLDHFGVSSKPIITHHMCHSPNHYNIKCLPKEMKGEVDRRYREFIEYSMTNYSEDTHKHVHKILTSVTNFMNSEDTHDKYWKAFIEHTKSLDNIRDQSTVEAVPEYEIYLR